MRVVICILLAVSAVFALAAETPIPPAPTRFVTDTVNFLSPAVADRIDRGLEQFERDSGHQLLVYIGQTTGDAPIEDWAVRAFEKWKVGRKGMDDGAVLFIMAQDRRLRIEVGYGLEGQIPDALAGRIINEVIVPKIQANDRDGAVLSGVEAMLSAVSGQGLPASSTSRRNPGSTRPMSLGEKIVFGVIGLFVLIMLATNPSLAMWLLMSMMSGGGRGSRGGGWSGGGGGWSGGGGGFGGGGGRSGGGGASGSW